MTMADTKSLGVPEAPPARNGRYEDRPTERPAQPPAGEQPKKDRMLGSLIAVAVVLTVLAISLGVWGRTTSVARASEQVDAEQRINRLETRLADTRDELASTEDAVGVAEAAAAEVSGSLDRVRGELRSIERLFPIDLDQLDDVAPDGSFTVTTELLTCEGWSDCGDDNWEGRLKRLSITCDDSCTVGGIDGDLSGSISFDSGAWTAEGPYGATCRGVDSDSSWSLELRALGLELDGQGLAVERYGGVLRYIARPNAGNCAEAEVTIALEAVRR